MPETPEYVAEVTEARAQCQDMSDNAQDASDTNVLISQIDNTEHEQTEPQPADCTDSTQNVDSSSTADFNQTSDSITLENCASPVPEPDTVQQQPGDTAATPPHTEEPVNTAVTQVQPHTEVPGDTAATPPHTEESPDTVQQKPGATAITQTHAKEPADTAVEEKTPDVEAVTTKSSDYTMDTAVASQHPTVSLMEDTAVASQQPTVSLMEDTAVASQQPTVSLKEDTAVASQHPTVSIKEEVKSLLEIKVEEMELEQAPSDKQECQQTRNLFETVGLVLRSNTNQVANPEKTKEEVVFGGDLSEQTKHNDDIYKGAHNTTPVATDKEPESNTDPSYCHFCGFPAATADIYHKHMKFHDKSTVKCSCTICGFNYKDREIIIAHYSKFHALSEASLKKCETCKFVSSDEQNLADHIRQHFLIRPHACGVCYMTFVTMQGYNRHMGMKHSKEEQLSVGYIAQNHKRKRGTSVEEGSTTGNKRSKQTSKSRSISKQPLTDSPSSKEKKNGGSGSKSDQSNSSYFVLSTKSLVLTCSFCDILTANKRELTQHLLSSHGHELVTLKPF